MRKPSKNQINQYIAFIEVVSDFAEDMPDGAFFATMQSETKRWLAENGFNHLDPYDFYLQYGAKR